MIRILSLILTIFLAFASSASTPLRLEGNYTEGGLLYGEMPIGAKAFFDGKPAHQFGNRLVIGFGRDDKESHQLKIKFADGKVEQQQVKIEQRKYDIQKIFGVEDKYVNPSKKALVRIKKENSEIAKARYENKAECSFSEKWIKPAEGVISGVYGSQRIFNNVPKRPHFGLDMANKIGTPVTAPKSGYVVLTNEDMFYTGKTVIVNHGCGISSTFIHMSKIDVKEGQYIKQGDKMGEIGQTGRATGPHLHWGVYLFNIALDPGLLIK